MAVTIDIGQVDTLVPRDKLDVGHRLALWAKRLVLGKTVVCSGPLYSGMKAEGGQIRLSFTEIGGGLVIGAAPSIQVGVPPAAPLSELRGFAIAGADQRWVAATARIDGATIVVSSPQVPQPVAARYAWADNPECNLYNKEALPAAPFRTDQP
jgi:sialate O-acetylesterase